MTQMPWLPQHRDFGVAIRAAKQGADRETRIAALAHLAGHDLDLVATDRLDRLLGVQLDREDGIAGIVPSGLAAARLALLGTHTLDHLVPAIRVGALRRGLALSTHVGEYGQVRHALLMGDTAIEAFAPQFVLLAFDQFSLVSPLPMTASAEEVARAIETALAELRALWAAVRDRLGAQPLQQTLLAQSPPLIGSNEALLPASPSSIVRQLNAALRVAAAEAGVPIVDVATQMTAELGGDRLYDPVRWHQAKQLVNPVFAPLYGDLVGRVVGAAMGLSRKCLILDCDNTLWGGVIGDDGIEHIKLGQGSAEGEAYLAFQHYVASLGQRGVILAVCSKNDHDIARAVFDRHPETRLAYDDIACFVANWNDKAANIRSIAATLNIGTDSLVFIDDNPAERAIVRRELPEVAVPELPEDAAFYADRIAAAGYFEAVAITADDMARSRSYAANTARAAAAGTATDMAGFLRSLEMTLVSGPISPIDRPRAAQLINKSNQFNLTTRRRTEAELATLVDDPDVVTLCFRLRDRFGDNGLISVVIARRDHAWADDALLIDTWLMSCRVLGRGVEAAALDILAEAGRELGARALIGEFRPSGRNSLVERHYADLGFSPVSPPPGAETGTTFWRLDIAELAAAREHHLTLEAAA